MTNKNFIVKDSKGGQETISVKDYNERFGRNVSDQPYKSIIKNPITLIKNSNSNPFEDKSDTDDAETELYLYGLGTLRIGYDLEFDKTIM
ncbi:hypothetical protein KAU11_09455 [Candidatus Babeliales bacterium]|nr:hypothetical protein [Candidatus Babeliales bacterium]